MANRWADCAMIESRVIIVGGGPVGLLSALMLGRAGIPVALFERNTEITDDPRAATTHPATLELLHELGLTEELEAVGLRAPIFQFWDRVSGGMIAEFDHAVLADETEFPYVIQCEQAKLSRIAHAKLQNIDCVELVYGAEVVSIQQTDGDVSIDVSKDGETWTEKGAYALGTDGGRSFVRKALAIPFSGFTWEEKFLVLTTPFDFAAEKNYSYRSYFAGLSDWCNCFKVAAEGPPGLWRTVFPADATVAEEEILADAAVQECMQSFFPKDSVYEIIHRNIYTVHQRVADTFRKGRILLAGDASHVNNPIGGMGLNGGIQDAANLCSKLITVLQRQGDDSLLDLYSHQRRWVATEFVQQQSIAHKRRLENSDAKKRQDNLDDLQRKAADKSLAKEFLLGTSMITSQRIAASLTLNQ
jgi:3-(3-hydroxy-phenyl)propionate hydroxylase